jgi:hypothetical protein
MLGGGFLGQMNDTMKRNRAMIREALGRSKRPPFDNEGYSNSTDRKELIDKKQLSASEREKLIEKVVTNNKRELVKRLLIFLISIIIVASIRWFLKTIE